MATKIGLLGDVHATVNPVAEALAIFRNEGVDRVWCTGDVAGYGDELDETVGLLKAGGCHVILGNHDQWYLDRAEPEKNSATADYLADLPLTLESWIEGKCLHMVHASPPNSLMDGIRLLDEAGQVLPDQQREWTERLAGFGPDVLIVGHTHQVFAEQLGNILVINPGSTLFNHCCAILSLPDMQFRLFGLSGKQPIRTWRWDQQNQEWPLN
ncbi:metallophosphoesterase family protein [Pseudomonadota bacterium]